MHRCKDCGASKPREAFYISQSGNPESRCKACRKVRYDARMERLKRESPEVIAGYYRRFEERAAKLVECPQCHTEFSARRRGDPARAPHQVYCSKSCAALAIRPSGPDNPRWVEKVSVKCKACGKTFGCYPCWVKDERRQFCSRRCASDWMRTASDYIYGKNWPRQRRLALKRDNRTCQHCASREHIHVHHIQPFRLSKSNALKNLVCLCASCHTTEEARLRAVEDRTGEQLRLPRTARSLRRSKAPSASPARSSTPA